MPGPVPYTDIGGGGPNPPHGEDFFDRIVNVHWPEERPVFKGGVFVAADGAGGIYYLKIGLGGSVSGATGKLVWQNVGNFNDPGSGYGYRFSGSAYGLVGQTPTFVVVGYGNDTNSTGGIYASRDGLSWSNVFTLVREQENRNRGATIFAVTWDGSRFWAGAHQSLNRDPDGDNRVLEIDILLSSPDGFSWGEAGRYTIVWIDVPENPDGGTNVYVTGLLEPHCSPLVHDSPNGNKVPGGVFGYDGKTLIAPSDPPQVDYFIGGVGFGGAGSGGSGLIVTDYGGGGGSFPSDPGITVSGVATAGGAWVAAGGVSGPESGTGQAAILIPSSVGEHGVAWQRLDPSSGQILTICGGQVP